MNLKKLITGFFLCIICAATIGGVSVNAKSKKIKLVPETKNETFELLFVDVIVSLKPSDIQKIEYQNGKVKKTSDKYWSNACKLEYFYEGSKKNTTEVKNDGPDGDERFPQRRGPGLCHCERGVLRRSLLSDDERQDAPRDALRAGGL